MSTIAFNHLIAQILAVPVGLILGVGLAAVVQRKYRPAVPASLPAALEQVLAGDGPRHLLDETAEHSAEEYEPRHAAPYEGRHEADATGTGVVLGAHPDGDIALVRAYVGPTRTAQLGDAPTEEQRALIGAAA